MKFYFENVSGDASKIGQRDLNRIAKAATATMRNGGAILKREARAAMASGKMSTRFQNAFRVNIYPTSGVALNPAIFAYSKIPWAGQFENPQPVTGSPLIWLPIEQNLPLQARGKRWTPHDFANNIGPLRSGRHGSTPLLFGLVRVGQAGGVLALPSDAKRGHRPRLAREVFAKQKKVWRPVFVGVTSVSDPRRFDVSAVAAKVEAQLGGLYAEAWKESENG